MNMYSLIADQTRAAIEWDQSAKAVALLSELDFVEREADRYSGKGWHGVVEAFTERRAECLDELCNLRSDALDTAARLGSGSPPNSDDWYDHRDAADDQAVTVAQAADRARKLHFGDALDAAA